MTRKRKILIIAAAIIFGLLVGGYFLLQSGFLLNKVRGIMVTQLTNQLGTEVKLGRLSGNLLSGIKIEAVAIADKTNPDQTIISMEELGVKYQLSKLILRTIAIKELTLQKPVIYATVDEQGKMNLAELIPQPKPEDTPKLPKKLPFLIQAKKFELVDGHIFYKDKLHNIDANISGISIRVSGPFSPWNHKGKVAFQDATIEVNDVKKQIGIFDLDFHLTQENGKLERLRLEMDNSWLEARAETTFKSPQLQAKVDGEIDLKDVAGFSPSTKGLEGIVRLNVSTDGPWEAPAGNLELTAPTISFNSMNVAEVSVDADFTKDSVNLTKLSANIADGNILATAQAKITDGEPDYDAQVFLTSISIQPLLSALSSEPGKLVNPDLSGLPSITGTIQGEMKVNGKGRELNRLNTAGQLEFKDITFNSVKMLPSIIDYTLANEQLSVKANLDKIQAEINGKLALMNQTDLKVNLTSIDLTRLAEFALPDFGIAGIGALQANITGELTNPEVLANLTVKEIALNETLIGSATGEFLYSENQVSINDLMLRNATTQGIVRGSIELSDIPIADLNLSLNPLDISEYTKLVGKQPLDLKGQVLGEIDVRGPVTALDGSGELITQELRAFSLPIEMKIPLRLKKGILNIPELMLKTTGGEIKLSAVYHPTGEYEFQLNSSELNLASVVDEFGIKQLKGYGQILASGEGMIAKPKADIHLTLKTIQYGDIEVGDVAYKSSFDKDKIQFDVVALADTFKLEGEISATNSMPFNVNATLDNLDFGALLGVDEDSGKISGATTGVLDINGEIANVMNSNGKIQLQSLAVNTMSHSFFNDKPIEIEFADGKIDLKQFELFQRTDDKIYSALALKGHLALPIPDEEGRISQVENNFTAQANEFNLSVLNDFITGGQSHQKKPSLNLASLSGVGRFNLHIKGSYSNPELVFDWEFPEIKATSVVENIGKVPDTAPSALSIPINSRGNVTYRNKILTLDQIQLALYNNPLTLTGEIPINLTSLTVSPPQSTQTFLPVLFPDSPMGIQLTATNWDISFMEQFIADIDKIGGYTNISLDISGSPINPKVLGNILLRDISMQSQIIPPPLENLSASINVDIDLSKIKNQASVPWLTCNLDSFQWNIGPGRYSTSASVKYRLQTPHTREIASWFDDDGLNAIKDSIIMPEVELTFAGEKIDLGAFAMASRDDVSRLPFDGRTSVFAEVNGKGIRPQNYTAKVEIEPLVLALGDYDLRNDEKIEITFQDGQLKFDSIILKSRKAGPEFMLSFVGAANLDGNFNLKMLVNQFHLEMLSPFLINVPPLGGLVSVQLDANGTPTKPNASARFEVKNIRIQNIAAVEGDINVDTIEGSIALKNDTLTVNPTSIKTSGNEIIVHGAIPLNLMKSTEISEPMQIFITGENFDLAPFAYLSPIVEEIGGKVNIDMALRDLTLAPKVAQNVEHPDGIGSIPISIVNPYLTGNLTMTNGRIKLVNLTPPIEALKFELIARQPRQSEEDSVEIEHTNDIAYELSFQIGSAKHTMAGKAQMDGLMPRQYDGTLNLEKFPLDIITRNFLKGDIADKLSGHLSVNVETKLNVGELLNIPQNLKLEQKFWKFISAAMGSKVKLPEMKVQMAGYPTIYNPQPLVISLDEGILSLPGWQLDYQSAKGEKTTCLRTNGRLDSNNQVAFDLKGFVDTKMVADLTQSSKSLAELIKSTEETPLYGIIECRVSVRGSASKPQITVSWPNANLGFLGSDMELSASEISYEQGAFNIKEIKVTTEKADIGDTHNINIINITGRVPFHLSLMPPAISPPIASGFSTSQDELDLQISVSIEKFDSLPLLAVQNATIDGNGQINIKVIGPIQAPQFFGDVTLKDFVYQYENVSVTDTNVKLTLNRDGINIEQARGKFNEGLYQSWGKISLSEYKLTDLNISGNWRDVKWEQEGIVSATSEGSVQLLGTFDKPRLIGNATVNSGSFEQSWKRVAIGVVSGQPKGRSDVILDYPIVNNLELDLNVQVPQLSPNEFLLDTVGTKIKPQVNGRVVGPLNPPNRIVFVGRVDILEGEFSYFNRKFLIKSGTIENSSPYVLDPKYEIDAEVATPIVAEIPEEQEPKNVRISLKIAGTLKLPQTPVLSAEVTNPTPGEQYDFNQLQILSLLAFGNIASEESQTTYSTSETVTNLITRQTEMFVGAQLASKLNLSELQLGISDKEASAPQFRVTKEISSQWAVTYMSTYSLSAKPYLLGVEYKINKNISIAGSRNEYGKYGMNLKYGIEW